MILYPYKTGSQGAKDLATAVDIKQIKKEGSKFKGASHKLVINWGNSKSTDEVDKCMVINKPECVAICSDKLAFFNFIQRTNDSITKIDDYVEIPLYSTKKTWALDMCESGTKIVCRTVLNGHSGEGIHIADTPNDVVDAPLYVEYRLKKTEYRVHIMHDKVVDVQRKARDHNIPDDQVNWQVRNHKYGFVFVRDENPDTIPKNVLTQALNAVKMVGLDFGAVDIIYNSKHRNATVLEINTAPGLSGTTLEGYKSRFKEFGEIFEKIAKQNRGKTAREIYNEARMNWVEVVGVEPDNYFVNAIAAAAQARIN